MKKKIMLKSIVIILLVVEVISLYLLYNTENNEVLDDVVTTSLKNKKQTIAVMVQQDDNTWRAAENRNAWPSSTTYGFVGSKCYDGNGALVESSDIVSFDLSTYTATINTTNSIYCTLYFAKGTPALELLQEKGKTTFASGNLTAVDGMYRFKGTASQVLNNYICFGTTVESTCTTNKSGNYMYRIIGITSTADSEIGLHANQLKIIRAVPSDTSQSWHTESGSNYPWASSLLKSYLNTTFLNTIKAFSDGTYWDSMISQHGWYIKGLEDPVGAITPKDETLVGDINNRIGLMYAGDYYNSWTYDSNTNSWLFIANGWNGNPSLNEWTMSKSIEEKAAYVVSVVGFLSWMYGYAGYSPYPVRPVFYLQSGVNLSGEGTKDHPFIISGVMPQD